MNKRKYNKEYLISELVRFNKENGKPPIAKDLDGANSDYPSRRTYVNHFGTFGNALVEAGFDYRGIENFQIRNKKLPKNIVRFTKEIVKELIDNYVEKNGHVPSLITIESLEGYPTRHDFRRLFGGFNNAILEFGYKPKNTINYSDEELKEAFLEFVSKYNRIPSITDFNDSEYPSFWCYQNRFGSWNKAVESYGFPSNNIGTGFCHEFEDGEIVKSKYEFDTSKYLRENNIKYRRDVLYKDYVIDYEGRKNCDYVVDLNGENLFIEIAGFITDSKKKSSIEKDYIKRFEHKLSILNKSDLNFIVLYPKDFKTKSLEEVYYFLHK